ncbi:unnamed protein product, partial [Ectocarpus sp. 12 AP-2014]
GGVYQAYVASQFNAVEYDAVSGLLLLAGQSAGCLGNSCPADYSNSNTVFMGTALNAATGELVWSQSLDADADDSSGEALGVALDAAGGVVFMAGSMSEPDEDSELYMAAFEIATGQVLWTWTHGTIYSDILTDLAFDEENGVLYACGYTRGDFSYALDADPAPEVKLQDMVVLALDPSTQETIWLKTYTSGPLVDRADFAFTITFDRNGVLHVGGTTRGTGFDTDGSAGEDDPDTRPRLLRFVFVSMSLDASDGETLVSYQSLNYRTSRLLSSVMVPDTTEGDLYMGGHDGDTFFGMVYRRE